MTQSGPENSQPQSTLDQRLADSWQWSLRQLDHQLPPGVVPCLSRLSQTYGEALFGHGLELAAAERFPSRASREQLDPVAAQLACLDRGAIAERSLYFGRLVHRVAGLSAGQSLFESLPIEHNEATAQTMAQLVTRLTTDSEAIAAANPHVERLLDRHIHRLSEMPLNRPAALLIGRLTLAAPEVASTLPVADVDSPPVSDDSQ